MKPSLLFVDDEPRILQAMRRCLYAHRATWDIEFASSGAAALEVLRSRRVDALVTDMRMPEMDGLELLRRARRDHGTTMRFVLSGQTEFAAAIDSVALAHQFLGKPCAPAVVMDAVCGAHETLEALGSRAARDAIVPLTTLPSSPSALERFDAAVAREDAAAMSAEIASDVAMSAKVLQVAQSTFFGGRGTGLTVGDAVRLLGTPVLGELRRSVFDCQTWRAAASANVRDDAPFALRVGELVQRVTEGTNAIPTQELGSALLRLWGIGAPVDGRFTPI